MSNSKECIWPEGKRFAVCLTHDVDEVKKTFQHLTHFLKTDRLYHLVSMFMHREPYWNFEKIMRIEEKYRVRSTFFFLHETKKIDLGHLRDCYINFNRYRFHDKKIAEMIRRLHHNGWEIALHGSYDSYKNKALLAKEKDLLEDVVGAKVVGVRQHFLNLSIPSTWQIQKELGLQYDASFGYNDEVGFREGKLLPFRPFNDRFLVIPLTAMDYALFFQFRTRESAAKKMRQLIEQAVNMGALLTVLWHQRVFNENEFPGWSKIYEEIIRLSVEKSAWIARAKEVAEWWNLKYCQGHS